jgi:hypothetical protein
MDSPSTSPTCRTVSDTMSHHTVVVSRPAKRQARYGSEEPTLQRRHATAYDTSILTDISRRLVHLSQPHGVGARSCCRILALPPIEFSGEMPWWRHIVPFLSAFLVAA